MNSAVYGDIDLTSVGHSLLRAVPADRDHTVNGSAWCVSGYQGIYGLLFQSKPTSSWIVLPYDRELGVWHGRT